jgi:hypothetical protein
MKKHVFYSLIMQNNKIIAKQWFGYTCGRFNYYKNEWGKWEAIEPTTGLSVTYSRNTRKECEQAANTPEMLEKVKNAVTEELQERFNKIIWEQMTA